MDYAQQARRNLETHLAANPYPGRGLVVGRADNGQVAIVYFIMGRSENSRNRRFLRDGERLWTEAVDPAKVTDPSLIIYDAMLALPGIQLVSNGDQTRTVYDYLQHGATFEAALNTREREPDSPNFTPRITAMVSFLSPDPRFSLALLRANAADPDRTDRLYYHCAGLPAGLGLGLTTYMGDGDPLPSYRGEPLWLPLEGSAAQIADTYWSALNPDNRVSLAVKCCNPDGTAADVHVINRHA